MTDEDEEAVEEELAGIIEEQLPSVPISEPIEDNEEEKEAPAKEKVKQKQKESVALEA